MYLRQRPDLLQDWLRYRFVQPKYHHGSAAKAEPARQGHDGPWAGRPGTSACAGGDQGATSDPQRPAGQALAYLVLGSSMCPIYIQWPRSGPDMIETGAGFRESSVRDTGRPTQIRPLTKEQGDAIVPSPAGTADSASQDTKWYELATKTFGRRRNSLPWRFGV